jgi:hypothetical protein
MGGTRRLGNSMSTPIPFGNPWRKTSYRYWHHALTTWPLYLKAYWQRARNGYSTPDVWGFDTYLGQVIAGGLRELAKGNAMPPMGSTYYPPDIDWAKEDRADLHEAAHEAWVADLNAAAEILERYVDDELVSWEEEQLRYDEARVAMTWVAENFGSLWD